MWDTYKEDGNAEAYTDTLVKTFRAISEPVLRNRLGLSDATAEVGQRCCVSCPPCQWPACSSLLRKQQMILAVLRPAYEAPCMARFCAAAHA